MGSSLGVVGRIAGIAVCQGFSHVQDMTGKGSLGDQHPTSTMGNLKDPLQQRLESRG